MAVFHCSRPVDIYPLLLDFRHSLSLQLVGCDFSTAQDLLRLLFSWALAVNNDHCSIQFCKEILSILFYVILLWRRLLSISYPEALSTEVFFSLSYHPSGREISFFIKWLRLCRSRVTECRRKAAGQLDHLLTRNRRAEKVCPTNFTVRRSYNYKNLAVRNSENE